MMINKNIEKITEPIIIKEMYDNYLNISVNIKLPVKRF